MKLYKIALYMLWAVCGMACSDDDDTAYSVTPETSGAFTDARDGYTYHWVRIGGLDWMVENTHFYTDDVTCTIQQDDRHGGSLVYLEKHWERYGYLYNYRGAMQAVPEGWRIPTDEDWQKLERTLGMSEEEAQQKGWRGNVASLMQQKEGGTMLDMLLGGYYTPYMAGDGAGYRFLACYGYFWTSTQDTDKDGEYIFFRKLAHGSEQVCRESMEKDGNKISLRLVRDAQ